MALRVSGMVWSEPLFVVVVLGLLIALEEWMRSPRLGVLAAAVGLSWCGFLLRYSGIALAGVCLTVASLVWLRQRGLRGSIGRIALLAGALAVVPVAWALRNIAEGSGAFGDRASSTRGVLTNLRHTIETISSWVVPGGAPVALRVVALAAVVLAASALAWYRIRAAADRPAAPSSPDTAGPVQASLLPIIVYVVIYLIVEIGSSSVTNVNRLDERLLYPVFVPILVLVAWSAEALFSNPKVSTGVRTALVLGFVAWLVVQAGFFAKTVRERERDGIAFADLSWQASPLIRDVEQLPGNARLHSNLPEPISSLTQRTVRFGPPRTLPENVDLGDEAAQLLLDAACGRPTYLVWFPAEGTRGFEMPLRLLARRVTLEPQARERDGTLYRVTSLATPSSTPEPQGNRCRS